MGRGHFFLAFFFLACSSCLAQLDDGESILGALPRVDKGLLGGIAKALNLNKLKGPVVESAAKLLKSRLVNGVPDIQDLVGKALVAFIQMQFPGVNVEYLLGSAYNPADIAVMGRLLPRIMWEQFDTPEKAMDSLRAMAKAVNIYRRIQKAMADADIDQTEGHRTAFKLISLTVRVFVEWNQYGPVFKFLMDGDTWPDFLKVLKIAQLSTSLTKDLVALGNDEEVLGVLRKFLKKHSNSDPLIVTDLATIYKKELSLVIHQGIVSGADVLARAFEIKELRNNLFSSITNEIHQPEMQVQMFRARYRRWRYIWRSFTSNLVREIPEVLKVARRVPDLPRPATGNDCDQVHTVDPFSMPLCRPSRPAYEYVPLLIVFGALVVAVGVVLTLGTIWKTASRFHYVILACLFASCALRLTFYVFWTMPVGEAVDSAITRESFPVSLEASHIVERLGAVLFAAVCSIFSFVLVKANFDAFFPDRKKLFFLLTVVGAVLIGCVAIYAITMVIVVSVLLAVETVVDASRVLLAVASAFFSLAVVAGFVVTWRSVRSDPLLQVARMRTLFFLASSCVLASLFVLSLIFTCLYVFESISEWGKAYFFTTAVAEALLGAAVVAYCCVAILSKRSPTSSQKKEEQKFEQPQDESAVPLLYSNY